MKPNAKQLFLMQETRLLQDKSVLCSSARTATPSYSTPLSRPTFSLTHKVKVKCNLTNLPTK